MCTSCANNPPVPLQNCCQNTFIAICALLPLPKSYKEKFEGLPFSLEPLTSKALQQQKRSSSKAFCTCLEVQFLTTVPHVLGTHAS